MPISRRAVVRHQKYEERLAGIARLYPRAPDILEGAEWDISHDPEQCLKVPELGDIRVAPIHAPGELPPVRLYFSMNRRYIHMLTIIFADDPKST